MFNNSKIINILKKDKFILILVIILLAGSLFPLVVVSKFNVMSADDYAMGKEAHLVWEGTHSFWSMFSYSVKHMYDTYRTWQGCFTVNFFDSWNPGFFSEKIVPITAIIMLSAILFSIFLFSKVMISTFYESSSRDNVIIAAVISFLTIQTMPSPVEGIFWYSGAIAYTFLHFLSILFFCLLVYEQKVEKLSTRIMIILCSGIVAFLIGGCQYVTVLECLIWYVVFIVINHKKIRFTSIIPFFIMLASFAINFFAPGNATRQESTRGLKPIYAILKSFLEAIRFAKDWFSPLFIISLLFLLPLIWKFVSKGKREYRYRYPLLVILFSYCIFSSCFTAPLYGVGNIDAGRIQNQIQIMFYLIVCIDLFYFIGWIQWKMKHSRSVFFCDLKVIIDILKKYTSHYRLILFAFIILIWLGTGDKNTFSSISALRSLLNGEAQIYYEEAQSRLEDYQNDALVIVEVAPFSVRPKVLYFNDVQDEDHIDYWINENIAAYYGKEKIILKKSE